jgi:hypothetical protein
VGEWSATAFNKHKEVDGGGHILDGVETTALLVGYLC